MTPRMDDTPSGWAYFAGIFFFVSGLFSLVAGLTALLRKEYFADGAMIYENLQAHGTAWLVLGVVELLVGWLVLGRSGVGRAAGILIAVVAMVFWFFAIGLAPFWAILNVALFAGILYGLTVGWGDTRRA